MTLARTGPLLSMLFFPVGCFQDPPSDGGADITVSSTSHGQETSTTSSSAGSSASSMPAGTSDEHSSSEATAAETTGSGTTSTGGDAEGTTTENAETTGSGGEVTSLCPQWSDAFDGPVDPVWDDVWAGSVAQEGGRTVLTLTSATGDQYPRRVISWPELGATQTDTVRYRMTPAILPTISGTQLNTIFEGPAGYDVTLSLNNPGSLEYRLTTRTDGMETLYFEGPAAFPPDGSVEFTIGDGSAQIRILDDTGAEVETFADVPLPFDPAEGRIGFAANNWAVLTEDAELAVEHFEIACEA